ncbi:PH domain-containing protein [Anaerocolumna sp.]|uniref:PH domain-containing protein n=1 Tax=Anaerocolumna sp. TaxID=2041569 RepID=UPI0028B02DCC|nr:PH domain-containing protein [Anaerocolumna sp.]
MSIRIILIIFMYPVLPIIYFLLKNEVKPKKNIVLGVTLPYSKINDPRVDELLAAYKKELNILTIILAPIPILPIFIKWFSIYYGIMILWILLVILVPYIPYIRYHHRLKSMKDETDNIKGVLEEASENANINEFSKRALKETTELMKSEKMVNHYWFLPPIIISLFPLAYEAFTSIGQPEYLGILLGCGTFTIITLLGAIFQKVIYKQEAEIVDEDWNINVRITRIRRQCWRKFWLEMTWASGIFTVVFWMFITSKISYFAGMILTLIYSGIIIYIAVKAEFTTRYVQEKLSEESKRPIYLDEDDHWIYGLFYYNPDDKKILVNDRVGIGTTMNLAHKTGKIVTLIAIVCMLTLPISVIYVIKEEFTPLTTKILDNRIVVTHIAEELDLPTEEIRSVEVVEHLPSTVKVVGTGMEHLLKGTFNVSGYGRCKLYLNPEKPPFLVMTTEDERIIINGNDNLIEEMAEKNLLNR